MGDVLRLDVGPGGPRLLNWEDFPDGVPPGDFIAYLDAAEGGAAK